MKNIEKQELAALKESAQSFYQNLNEANHWVTSNFETEQQDAISLKVKNARRIVRKIVDSIESKPVFALFGGSQVGKSYLVKNILSIDGAPLEIQFKDKKVDFLKEINPPGTGAESTGVVTRFTIDKVSPSDDFPVRTKLLNTKDVLLIICDSFFSDLKSIDSYPDVEAFAEHCEALTQKFQQASKVQSNLVEDDIFDIKDYFDKNFSVFSYYTEKVQAANYWSSIGKIIERIPPDQWTEVFSILWCNIDTYSKLFSTLVNALQQVNFTNELYLEMDAVLREGHAILDVQRLKELNQDASTCNAFTMEQKVIELSVSTVSALSKEVALSCDEKLATEKSFLNNTDLLDFPGARSRLELSLNSIDEEAIPDLFLRGKVAYLFNKYSGDFEINNLLFCQNDRQLDVNELPSLLHHWIENNIGQDAIDRDKNIANLPISPLFIVFTFFNNQLKYDSTNDDKKDIGYKWETRFKRFFEEELVTVNYDWHKKWTTSSPLFKNFYLLRDFKYSTDTFSGFEENGIETGIQSDRIDFLDQLKGSFLQNEFVQKHFDEPELMFSAAAMPNEDGSKTIIKNLEPAANNYIKVKNYITQLAHLKSSFTHLMTKYHYTDDINDLRKKALSDSLKVQLEMNRVFSTNEQNFDFFLEQFAFKEVEMYNFLHDNLKRTASENRRPSEYDLFLSQFPDVNESKTKEENLNIIMSSLGLSSTSELIEILEDQGLEIQKLFPGKKSGSTIDILLETIIENWIKQLEDKKQTVFKDMGFSAATIQIIMGAYERSFRHHDLFESLKSIVKEKYKGISLDEDAEQYLAAALTHEFNEFVIRFGVNKLSTGILDNVKSLQPQLKDFIIKYSADKPLPNDAELAQLFDRLSDDFVNINESNAMIEGYNNYLNCFKIMMLANCGFVHYDVQENAKLGSLIEHTNSLEFEIK